MWLDAGPAGPGKGGATSMPRLRRYPPDPAPQCMGHGYNPSSRSAARAVLSALRGRSPFADSRAVGLLATPRDILERMTR